MPEVLQAAAATTNLDGNHQSVKYSTAPLQAPMQPTNVVAAAAAAAAMAMHGVRMTSISPAHSSNGNSNEATNGKYIPTPNSVNSYLSH